MSSPIRLGIIGYGIMGERLLRAALDHDPAVIAVAGLWDPSAEAMRRLGADLPQVAQLASADAVIEACDALYIASPPAFHLGYARAALARGRTILCEKPLAVDLAEARAFVEQADADGSRAAVNFVFTSSPGVAQLQAWLKEGRVGRVEAVEVEVGFAAWPRPWQVDAAGWLDRREQGGFTREVVSHFLFLSRRLFGPFTLHDHSVAYPEPGRTERSIAARLEAGGVPVSLSGTVGRTEKPDHNIFLVRGSEGAIRLRDWAIAEYRDADGGWREMANAVPNEKTRSLILRQQLWKLAALSRETSFPQADGMALASLREAVEVQDIVETILRG